MVPVLKRVFPYLLALCILAGMTSRLVAFDHCDTTHADQAADHTQSSAESHGHAHDCCPHSEPDQTTENPDDPGDDTHCPMDHHHHHLGCSHVMPLVADAQSRISLSGTAYCRLLLNVEEDGAPETPVYEMDKPPLI